jgi:hypothetical protein
MGEGGHIKKSLFSYNNLSEKVKVTLSGALLIVLHIFKQFFVYVKKTPKKLK